MSERPAGSWQCQSVRKQGNVTWQQKEQETKTQGSCPPPPCPHPTALLTVPLTCAASVAAPSCITFHHKLWSSPAKREGVAPVSLAVAGSQLPPRSLSGLAGPCASQVTGIIRRLQLAQGGARGQRRLFFRCHRNHCHWLLTHNPGKRKTGFEGAGFFLLAHTFSQIHILLHISRIPSLLVLHLFFKILHWSLIEPTLA